MANPGGRRAALTEVRQTIQFTMDLELHARVAAYHRSVDPNRMAAETYRELLWMAVSAADPNNGIVVASRIIAQAKAKGFVLSETSMFLNDLARRIERMAKETDANAVAEAQIAVAEIMKRVGGNNE